MRRSPIVRSTWNRPGAAGLSFYLYNTLDEVDYATDTLAAIVAGQGKRKTRSGRLRVRRGIAPTRRMPLLFQRCHDVRE